MSRKVKCLPFLLLSVLVLLAACQPGVGEAGASQSAASEEPFVFTRENMPRLDGSTSTVPLAQAMCAVLLGRARRTYPIWCSSPAPPSPTGT